MENEPFFLQQLVRRVTRQVFVVLHCNSWNKALIKQLNAHIEKSILDKSTSTGFLMHFTEIFLDELAKVNYCDKQIKIVGWLKLNAYKTGICIGWLDTFIIYVFLTLSCSITNGEYHLVNLSQLIHALKDTWKVGLFGGYAYWHVIIIYISLISLLVDARTTNSVTIFHFVHFYGQVSVGKISRSKVTLLIQPFAMCVAARRDPNIINHTIKHIFDALLYQSDLGRAYTEKFEAWKGVSSLIPKKLERLSIDILFFFFSHSTDGISWHVHRRIRTGNWRKFRGHGRKWRRGRAVER